MQADPTGRLAGQQGLVLRVAQRPRVRRDWRCAAWSTHGAARRGDRRSLCSRPPARFLGGPEKPREAPAGRAPDRATGSEAAAGFLPRKDWQPRRKQKNMREPEASTWGASVGQALWRRLGTRTCPLRLCEPENGEQVAERRGFSRRRLRQNCLAQRDRAKLGASKAVV